MSLALQLHVWGSDERSNELHCSDETQGVDVRKHCAELLDTPVNTIDLVYNSRLINDDNCIKDLVTGDTPLVQIVWPASDHADIVPVQPHLWPEDLRHTLALARAGLMRDLRPATPAAGSGESGTYFFWETESGQAHDANWIAVFKPMDEEAYAPNNPKDHIGEFGRQIFDKGVRSGECYLREAAAYQLDRGFAGVPMTALAVAWDPSFHVTAAAQPDRLVSPFMPPRLHNDHSIFEQYGFKCPADLLRFAPNATAAEGPPASKGVYRKLGSFQAFMDADCNSDDYSQKFYPTSEVHKIAILDLRLLNADRHGENILLQWVGDVDPRGRAVERGNASSSAGSRRGLGGYMPDLVEEGQYPARLIPIDHGCCLPDTLDIQSFECVWYGWPQIKRPLSDAMREYVANIDIERDVALLREEYGIREACLANFRYANTALKIGVAAGLTLFQIADMVFRPDLGVRSELELIVANAHQLAAYGHSNVRLMGIPQALMDQAAPPPGLHDGLGGTTQPQGGHSRTRSSMVHLNAGTDKQHDSTNQSMKNDPSSLLAALSIKTPSIRDLMSFTDDQNASGPGSDTAVPEDSLGHNRSLSSMRFGRLNGGPAQAHTWTPNRSFQQRARNLPSNAEPGSMHTGASTPEGKGKSLQPGSDQEYADEPGIGLGLTPPPRSGRGGLDVEGPGEGFESDDVKSDAGTRRLSLGGEATASFDPVIFAESTTYSAVQAASRVPGRPAPRVRIQSGAALDYLHTAKPGLYVCTATAFATDLGDAFAAREEGILSQSPPLQPRRTPPTARRDHRTSTPSADTHRSNQPVPSIQRPSAVTRQASALLPSTSRLLPQGRMPLTRQNTVIDGVLATPDLSALSPEHFGRSVGDIPALQLDFAGAPDKSASELASSAESFDLTSPPMQRAASEASGVKMATVTVPRPYQPGSGYVTVAAATSMFAGYLSTAVVTPKGLNVVFMTEQELAVALRTAIAAATSEVMKAAGVAQISSSPPIQTICTPDSTSTSGLQTMTCRMEPSAEPSRSLSLPSATGEKTASKVSIPRSTSLPQGSSQQSKLHSLQRVNSSFSKRRQLARQASISASSGTQSFQQAEELSRRSRGSLPEIQTMKSIGRRSRITEADEQLQNMTSQCRVASQRLLVDDVPAASSVHDPSGVLRLSDAPVKIPTTGASHGSNTVSGSATTTSSQPLRLHRHSHHHIHPDRKIAERFGKFRRSEHLVTQPKRASLEIALAVRLPVAVDQLAVGEEGQGTRGAVGSGSGDRDTDSPVSIGSHGHFDRLDISGPGMSRSSAVSGLRHQDSFDRDESGSSLRAGDAALSSARMLGIASGFAVIGEAMTADDERIIAATEGRRLKSDAANTLDLLSSHSDDEIQAVAHSHPPPVNVDMHSSLGTTLSPIPATPSSSSDTIIGKSSSSVESPSSSPTVPAPSGRLGGNRRPGARRGLARQNGFATDTANNHNSSVSGTLDVCPAAVASSPLSRCTSTVERPSPRQQLSAVVSGNTDQDNSHATAAPHMARPRASSGDQARIRPVTSFAALPTKFPANWAPNQDGEEQGRAVPFRGRQTTHAAMHTQLVLANFAKQLDIAIQRRLRKLKALQQK